MSKISNITGERIYALRTKLGLYQSDLADQLEMNRNNISRYEKGIVKPPIETIAKIAAILKTSTDYLLGNTENPDPADAEAEFDREIELSDDKLLEKYNFTVDGQPVDEEAIKRILEYLRVEKRLKG